MNTQIMGWSQNKQVSSGSHPCYGLVPEVVVPVFVFHVRIVALHHFSESPMFIKAHIVRSFWAPRMEFGRPWMPQCPRCRWWPTSKTSATSSSVRPVALVGLDLKKIDGEQCLRFERKVKNHFDLLGTCQFSPEKCDVGFDLRHQKTKFYIIYVIFGFARAADAFSQVRHYLGPF